jgi:lipid-A-disaccharide synthase
MIMKRSKVFIIAGEVSGDVLGAGIMRAAKGARFSGIGGASMEAAGLKSLFPISDLSVMGVGEVVLKSKTLIARIRTAADAIVGEAPDVVLTIDSPSFAARVVKRVRKRLKGAGPMPRFYHVVAPMVWAWGRRRAKKYARIFDRLFCLFGFEKPYFEKYGLKTTVIGHPIYDMVRENANGRGPGAGRGGRPVVALLPGSRMGEASKIMPVYERFAAMRPEYDFAIPTTETTREYIGRQTASWKRRPALVPFADRYGLYGRAKFAVSVIGTATAELAIMHIPAVVVHKPNRLTEIVAKLVLRIKWKSLVNILANREIYPELNGGKASAENINEIIRNWDTKKIISELKAADKLWRGKEKPMSIVAAAISNIGARA